MQWNKLSSQQRDGLVHAVIMQLPLETPCTDPHFELNVYADSYWLCTCGWQGRIGIDGPIGHNIPVPSYTTDMNAAWRVVDRISRPPTTLAAAERAANTRFGFWFDREHLWSYTAKDAAEAICKAALLAAGARFEDEEVQ